MRIKFKILLVFFTINCFVIQAQNLPNIGSISNLSDSELKEYVAAARAQGYTVEQIKTLASAQGVSPAEISLFEARILGQGLNSPDTVNSNNALSIAQDDNNIAKNNPKVIIEESPLFGYDFFNNPNISFTPNLNLATPTNYQLGPGDELVINLWGAAENTYEVAVDRNGAIRIPSIGPIYISGSTFEVAEGKIKSALRRIYGGITAPKNSSYRVNVDVALINVRTVQVNIIGQVKAPGTYSLSGLSTVLNGLYAAGGPTREGTFRKVKLIRNGQDPIVFDIYKYLLEGNQTGNTTLQDQDIIIVDTYTSKVTVSGALKRPGIYEMLPQESLNDLINYASGFKSNAYRDNIKLERIEGDRKIIKEVSLDEFRNSTLRDGDLINVDAILDGYENKLEIVGAVYRPGNYAFTEGVTIKDLISKASGIRQSASLDKGIIIRSKDDGISKEAIPFVLSDIMSGQANMVLKKNDVVRIFDTKAFASETKFFISGAVNNPGDFPYVENLTVSDLIVLAGGFSLGADKGVIDVFRKVIDNNFETLSESFKVNLSDENGSEPFLLQPNDRVAVRSLKGIADNKRVTIQGEVNFPGAYTVSKKNERISDLVSRAGGLSPYAFVNGGVLIRRNPYFKENDPIDITLDNSNVSGASRLNNQQEYSVGIDLQEILEDGYKSKSDLILEDGDKLIIPSVQETIKIEGRVIQPSLVKFDKNLTLRDYIEKSGGFADRAHRRKTYVIYPNGDIATSSNFLFFRNYPKIRAGAIVIVPTKPEPKNRISLQEGVGILSGIATLGLLVDRIFN